MLAFPFQRWPALLVTLTVASLVGGCFRPMYGTNAINEGPNVVEKLRAIEVAPIKTSGADPRVPRVGGQVRSELIFQLTGGGEPNTTDYRIALTVSGALATVFSNVRAGRADNQSYGVTASYSLVDVSTGKQLFTDTTFSRVAFDLPGQQYFAAQRMLRDAENRAAKMIAENIRNRLASYFYSGS